MIQHSNFGNKDILYANSKKVSCDGSSSSSKHPLVYLHMGENDFVVCPYCSKYFSLNKNPNSNINIFKNKKN